MPRPNPGSPTILLLAGLASFVSATPRPNFLLIAVDDLNHYTTQQIDQPGSFLTRIYPDPAVRAAVGERLTPNLRRLAAQSTAFTQTYCPSPLCGPSRTALLTGVPTHLSGYYQHPRHFRHHDSLRDVVTLPQYLKQNGYFTIGLGKVFHKPLVEHIDGVRHDWPDLDHSWSLWIERRMGANSAPDLTPHDQAARGANRRSSPYSPNNGLFTFGTLDVPVEQSLDFRNTRFAAELYRQGRAEITDVHGHRHRVVLPEDRPFFLAVGLFLPHLPWVLPAEFLARFPADEMTLDMSDVAWVEESVRNLPEGPAQEWLGRDFDDLIMTGEKLHGSGGIVPAWRDAIRHYLAAIAFADHCLGQMIDAIDESPHRDSTVVMLWGDHGWQLGDKRRFRKHALWDAANQTEFLWRDPAIAAASRGESRQHLVSLQDIFPTVAARAGLPIPGHVHGRDLASVLADPGAPWEQAVLMTYQEGNHALRTPTHRFIRYHNGTRELYDRRVDPAEVHNLAESARHVGELQALDTAMEAMLARTAADYRN